MEIGLLTRYLAIDVICLAKKFSGCLYSGTYLYIQGHKQVLFALKVVYIANVFADANVRKDLEKSQKSKN